MLVGTFKFNYFKEERGYGQSFVGKDLPLQNNLGMQPILLDSFYLTKFSHKDEVS